MTTTAGPTIDYRVTVDTSGANGPLQALEKRTDALGARMNRAVGGTVDLTSALQKGQPVVEKFATATTGVASALGGVGSQAGATAGAVSNLATMMMAGGPLGVALVATTTGLAAVVRHLDDVKEKAIEAENALRRQASFGLASYAAEVAALEKELENVGKTGIEQRIGVHEENFEKAGVAVAYWGGELDKVNAEIERQQDLLRQGDGVGASVFEANIKRLREEARVLDANLTREQENERLALRAIELLRQIEERENAAAEAAKKRADAQGRASRSVRVPDAILQPDGMDSHVALWEQYRAQMELVAEVEGFILADSFAAHDAMLKARADAEEAASKRTLELAARQEAERQRLAEETARRREQIELGTQAVIIDSTNAIAGSLLSSSMMLMEGLITGQEKALERAVAGFLASTGQQIAAIGLRAVIEGGIHSVNPAAPGSGAPMIAAGLAAIGIGMSMAGGGIALGHVAAGGQPGRALPGSSGGGGSLSGGGGLSTRETRQESGGGVVEAHYHFHAPVFDYNGSARAVRELYDHEQSELLGGRGRR